MKIHQLDGLIQAMYLVEYPDKLLLLDGGSRCDVTLVKDFITQELGRKITDLKLIVVTHVHPDHAGGVEGLRKLAKCKVAMANKPTRWYGGVRGIANYAVDIYLTHTVLKIMKRKQQFLLFNPYFKIDYHLDDAEKLPHFPEWQALFTPGHTDRDLTLYHEATRQAYVADLVIKTKKGFIVPYPISIPPDYRQSLKKIKQLQLKNVMLAHGGQIQVTDDDLDMLIKQTPRKPLDNNVMFNKYKRRLQKKLPF